MHDEIINPNFHLDKAYPCSHVRSSQVRQRSPSGFGAQAPANTNSYYTFHSSHTHSVLLSEISTFLMLSHLIWQYVTVGGSLGENVTTSWAGTRLDQAIRGSLPLSLSLECTLSSLFPQWKAFSRMKAWESNVFVETIWRVYVIELH